MEGFLYLANDHTVNGMISLGVYIGTNEDNEVYLDTSSLDLLKANTKEKEHVYKLIDSVLLAHPEVNTVLCTRSTLPFINYKLGTCLFAEDIEESFKEIEINGRKYKLNCIYNDDYIYL